MCWFSVKMTARLDVNATPGVRMSPLAPGIVPMLGWNHQTLNDYSLQKSSHQRRSISGRFYLV